MTEDIIKIKNAIDAKKYSAAAEAIVEYLHNSVQPNVGMSGESAVKVLNLQVYSSDVLKKLYIAKINPFNKNSECFYTLIEALVCGFHELPPIEIFSAIPHLLALHKNTSGAQDLERYWYAFRYLVDKIDEGTVPSHCHRAYCKSFIEVCAALLETKNAKLEWYSLFPTYISLRRTRSIMHIFAEYGEITYFKKAVEKGVPIGLKAPSQRLISNALCRKYAVNEGTTPFDLALKNDCNEVIAFIFSEIKKYTCDNILKFMVSNSVMELNENNKSKIKKHIETVTSSKFLCYFERANMLVSELISRTQQDFFSSLAQAEYNARSRLNSNPKRLTQKLIDEVITEMALVFQYDAFPETKLVLTLFAQKIIADRKRVSPLFFDESKKLNSFFSWIDELSTVKKEKQIEIVNPLDELFRNKSVAYPRLNCVNFFAAPITSNFDETELCTEDLLRRNSTQPHIKIDALL